MTWTIIQGTLLVSPFAIVSYLYFIFSWEHLQVFREKSIHILYLFYDAYHQNIVCFHFLLVNNQSTQLLKATVKHKSLWVLLLPFCSSSFGSCIAEYRLQRHYSKLSYWLKLILFTFHCSFALLAQGVLAPAAVLCHSVLLVQVPFCCARNKALAMH